MPLFDYICESCGEEFEALVMGSGKSSCPRCKSLNLKKKMSSFSVGGRGKAAAAAGASSKCSGCAGGSCGTCH